MLKSLPLLLLTATIVFAAPIPKGPLPDPLGRGYVGFFPQTSDDAEPIYPVTIRSVEPGSPAANAGLRAGDIFEQVGGIKPKSFNHLKDYVMNFRPGTEIKIVVRRRGDLKTLQLTLGARPPEADMVRPLFPVDPEP